METEIINISYSLIKSNWRNSLVSLISLLENSTHTINLYLTFGNDVDIDEIKTHLSILKEKYNEVLNNINFVKISAEQFKIFEQLNFSGIASLYRLILPNEFPDLKKFIHLTSATVITSDLYELFNLNLNNHPIACSESVLLIPQFHSSGKLFDQRIMIIDCELFRDNIIWQKFTDFTKKNYNFPVRDINLLYNAFFQDNWCKFELKYNYVDCWFSHLVNKSLLQSYDYKIARQNPVIINYYGELPQYNSCKHGMRNLWWRYAKTAPFEITELQSYKLSSTSAQNSFKYGWLMSRIWPYIKPYWFRILLGFAIAVPLGLLDGVTAFALKPYMDYVIGGKTFAFSLMEYRFEITSIEMAFLIPLGVILFAVFQGVLRYLNGYFSTWTSQRITNDVKFDLFDRLIHMHPQFFDDNSSGIIISRYMSDPATASNGIVDNIKTITTSVCGALGLIAVMIYSSWKLACIGVLVLCAAFIPVALIRKRIKEASNRNMVIGGNITTNINEIYSGNKVMAAYELQDRQNRYFREQIRKSFSINMSLYKRAGWMSPLMYLIASFGIATVLGVGTYLINSGQMTTGSFASFVTSLLLLYKPVKTLGNTLTGIQNIFVAMGRVFELFDLDSAIKECEKPIELKEFIGQIRFENVLFEYTQNIPVLKNLNLTVNKNETLAIVGNSGGGKSTLVNLLPRFYDIKEGSVKIDGIDIRDYTISSLRHNIAMVFQDNFLFSGTIRENIMMGNPNAAEEELYKAIASAHLEEMIADLPNGLDTLIGERGMTLSGGQRQRVAIARAMIKNTPIVILDEATSALDNKSEAVVQKALDNLIKNKTVFVIAHRLSTIKNADRIAVINEGELVELGSHDELMGIENGQYKALYEMQFKKQKAVAAIVS